MSSVLPDETRAAGSRATSLRMRLRNEARAAHEALDASFERLGLTEGMEDYARFLRVNHACLSVLEPLLSKSGLFERLGLAEAIPRAPAARADLDALKLRPMVPSAFPIADPVLAEAVGIAYVTEGSRLGARQLLKRFDQHRRVDNAAAIPTFLLRSAGDAERFRSFIEAAETLITNEREYDLAVEAANRTFDYFIGAVRSSDGAPCSGE